MVTKPHIHIYIQDFRYVLAKIQMVTKLSCVVVSCVAGYVLAKIQMVTKLAIDWYNCYVCYVLAKIQMVTKPQINIIII